MKEEVKVKDLIDLFCDIHNLRHMVNIKGNDDFHKDMIATVFEKNLNNIKSRLAFYINKNLSDGLKMPVDSYIFELNAKDYYKFLTN